MFKLTTAIREIIRIDHTPQPWEAHSLTVAGFKLEQGLWVRRTSLKPMEFGEVYCVPSRERVIEDAITKP